MSRTELLLVVLIVITAINTTINYVWFTLC